MNTAAKMVIGTGVFIAVSAVGYILYKIRSEDRPLHKEESIDSESVSENTQPLLIQVMDEVIIDSLEELYLNINTIQEMLKEKEGITRNALEWAETIVSKIEETVCAENSWTAEEYEEQIKAGEAVNDEEILSRIDTLELIVSEILKGNKPRVVFKFHPIFTKSLTISLYRHILLSHLFIVYKTVHDHKNSGENIDKKRYNEILHSIIPAKANRRCVL